MLTTIIPALECKLTSISQLIRQLSRTLYPDCLKPETVFSVQPILVEFTQSVYKKPPTTPGLHLGLLTN